MWPEIAVSSSFWGLLGFGDDLQVEWMPVGEAVAGMPRGAERVCRCFRGRVCLFLPVMVEE